MLESPWREHNGHAATVNSGCVSVRQPGRAVAGQCWTTRVSCRLAWLQWVAGAGLAVASEVAAPAYGRPVPHGFRIARASSTGSPQPVHRRCTGPIIYPHDVDATPIEASLRCRAMSQTPTYDQLRGERINADVPASEADPHQADRFGRHRLVDDALGAAVCGQPPGSEADLADCTWFGTVNSDRPGKHRPHEDVPSVPAISGPSPGPPDGLVGGWSWFTPADPDRAGSANAAGPDPPAAETDLRGQAPHADLPPPAGGAHQHIMVDTSRDARAGPPEAMTGLGISKALDAIESHWLSRRLDRFESRQRGSVRMVTEDPAEK